MRTTLVAFAAIAALLTGCAAPLSSLQTARTTPKGEFDLHVGLGGNISPTVIDTVLDTGEEVAKRAAESTANGESPDLSDQELEDLFAAAISSALFAPIPIMEIGLRYGILDNWDVGGVFTTAGWRLETKFGVLSMQREDPLDLSIGLVGMRQSFSPPIPDTISDVLSLEEFKRTDIMIPVLAGYHVGDWFFVYGGPKFVYTALEMGFIETISDATENAISIGDDMLMFGGVFGFGIGYDVVFLQLELNALHYSYSAEALGVPIDVSGLDLYPAGALRFEFY